MTGTSGPTHSESLGRWDQDSSSWRTSQASLWEVMDGHHMGAPWSESWPRSGMTRSGELYPLPMRAHHTSETGGGSWHIPTPTSADVYTGNMESSQQSDDSMHSVSLPDFVGRFPAPVADGDRQTNYKQGGLNPDWVSWLMGLPVGWTSLEPLPGEEYLDWLQAQLDGTWWLEERGLPRIATGVPDRVNRLKCLGNGIVPASLALFLRG